MAINSEKYSMGVGAIIRNVRRKVLAKLSKNLDNFFT